MGLKIPFFKMNDVINLLKKVGIDFKLHSHIPVYTVEDAKKVSSKIEGFKSKTLLLKSDTSFYLYVIYEDKKVDFSYLRKNVGLKLKFASVSDVKKVCLVEVGAVSPFSLFYSSHTIHLLIDSLIHSHDKVCFHPLDNSYTLEFLTSDFFYLLQLHNIPVLLLEYN